MMRFVSTRGEAKPVDFEDAVLQGFAPDGGLYVPQVIPVVSAEQIQSWATLTYQELAFEVVSLYIDRSIIPGHDLRAIIDDSYASFEHPAVIDLVPGDATGRTWIMELFHGPTLSFKDIAMGFLVNVIDYFLRRRGKHLNIVLATTGDTGPAAAWASAGKESLDCWALYPRGFITTEQERQMTTLGAGNVHPVGVENCPDGGDDLDLVVARLFADDALKKRLRLSSVNSINWCRVMVQAVHYFFGYFRAIEQRGGVAGRDRVAFSAPTGAFGNLFGGFLARSMGLPVEAFICANNTNNALHTAFSTGVFAKKDLVETVSNAIDIGVPYNFWRFLYFCCDCDGALIRTWMDEFAACGRVALDEQMLSAIRRGFLSTTITDDTTLRTIRETFESPPRYLLDPHASVAVSAAREMRGELPEDCVIVCLATAHPAKFPNIIEAALSGDSEVPVDARHASIEGAKSAPERRMIVDLASLEEELVGAMSSAQ